MNNRNTKVLSNLISFISEAGMLKRLRRAGWSVLGISPRESVADHSFRCVILGYIVAKREKADIYKVLVMTLFHDIHESRIQDLHKLSQKYLNVCEAEHKTFEEQLQMLPSDMQSELRSFRQEYEKQRTIESIIARDVDILECLLQAKEYYEQGHAQASHFMKKAPRFLKSKTARSLWNAAQKMQLSEWWVTQAEFKR